MIFNALMANVASTGSEPSLLLAAVPAPVGYVADGCGATLGAESPNTLVNPLPGADIGGATGSAGGREVYRISI